MKTSLIIAVFTLLASSVLAAPDQSLDKELATLAEQLASASTNANIKKIATLDFTDLQGNPSELGRFIAEQVAVNMVMAKRSFAVVDRANLKRILDEHKLSMSGLVNPENTKKLGQFSGVDAIILGRLTPMADSVAVSATITLTETAEVVGGAKIRISKSQDVQQLLEHSVQTVTQGEDKTPPSGEQPTKIIRVEVDKNSQQLGDLLVKVESLKHGKDMNGAPAIFATLFIVNINVSNSISVALNELSRPTMINRRGDVLTPRNTAGIEYVFENQTYDSTKFTEIPARKSVSALITFIRYSGGYGLEIGDFPPYRLQAGVFTASEQDGKLINVKKHNLMIDVEK
jgi:hypothetical protein